MVLLVYHYSKQLILIWVGFLGVYFEVGGGGGVVKLPRLKLVRIMLETWNLARTYTNIGTFGKHTF